MQNVTSQTIIETIAAAIESGDAQEIRAALTLAADSVGAKPNKLDFESREDFKSAMNAWADRRSIWGDVLRLATDAGIDVRTTHSATASKSGSITVAERRAVTFRPTFATWRR